MPEKIPPFVENGGPTEPPSIRVTSGQLGPRLSACDELAQRQVQAVQPRDDSARHGLQAIGGKQERNHQINDAAHRVADEEQPRAQQRHYDRGRRQEEGGQGEQEQQDGHKDSQQHHKRRSNQFQYQSHRFNPFLSSFYLYFTMRRQGQQCCRRLVNLVQETKEHFVCKQSVLKVYSLIAEEIVESFILLLSPIETLWSL